MPKKDTNNIFRKPFEEHQVDNIVNLNLDACPTCGGVLVTTKEPPKVHQQVELVDKPFIVTEYRQAWYWCSAFMPTSFRKMSPKPGFSGRN